MAFMSSIAGTDNARKFNGTSDSIPGPGNRRQCTRDLRENDPSRTPDVISGSVPTLNVAIP